jgi:hypothetical protein
MRKLPILLFLMIVLFGVVGVSAQFPVYHYDSVKYSCENYKGISTPISDVCCNNIDYCSAGANLADFSVMQYITNFGRYGATHSIAYCEDLIARAQIGAKDQTELNHRLAFAYGNCIHLLVDTVSHNEMVPYTISHTYLPNIIVHAPAEYKVEKILESKNPGLREEMKNSLNVVTCNRGTDPDMTKTESCRLVKMMRDSLINTYNKDYSNVDIPALIEGYVTTVGNKESTNTAYFGSYLAWLPFSLKAILVILSIGSIVGLIWLLRLSFKPLFAKIMIGVFSFLVLIILALVISAIFGKPYELFLGVMTPVSAILPVGNTDAYFQHSITNVQRFFQSGESYLTSVPDPTGYCFGNSVCGIQNAEHTVNLIWFGIIFVVIILIIWGFYNLIKNSRNMKRRRR